MNTTGTRRRRSRSRHVASDLELYVDGRLDPGRFRSIDAHMLRCDSCFALLVALHLRRAEDPPADSA